MLKKYYGSATKRMDFFRKLKDISVSTLIKSVKIDISTYYRFIRMGRINTTTGKSIFSFLKLNPKTFLQDDLSYTPKMFQCLFELERLYGLKPVKENGEYVLKFCKHNIRSHNSNFVIINSFLEEWEQKEKECSGFFTKEYLLWQFQYLFPKGMSDEEMKSFGEKSMSYNEIYTNSDEKQESFTNDFTSVFDYDSFEDDYNENEVFEYEVSEETYETTLSDQVAQKRKQAELETGLKSIPKPKTKIDANNLIEYNDDEYEDEWNEDDF